MFLTLLLSDDSLEIFLKNFPTYPNAFLVGGPADIFVIELTDQVHHTFAASICLQIENTRYHKRYMMVLIIFQLQKLKVEPVLVHYLSRMSALQGSTSVI